MDVAGSDAVKHYPAIVLNVGQDSSINRVSSFDYERFFFTKIEVEVWKKNTY